MRRAAIEIAAEIQNRGIERVLLRGDDDSADILKLTLLEHGVVLTNSTADWAVRCVGSDYCLEMSTGEVALNHPLERDNFRK